MCNQSVGLAASVIEKAGIPTVVISLLREITEKVKPPRALFVPFGFGRPLGKPHDAGIQTRIIQKALHLLESASPLPVFESLGEN
jgi:D-proline reductase (dithiol) PrdB